MQWKIFNAVHKKSSTMVSIFVFDKEVLNLILRHWRVPDSLFALAFEGNGKSKSRRKINVIAT